jgi:L-fucose isomerase-like protein
MRQSKIGMMGYKDMNLYGTLYDGVSLRSKIGVEIEHFEMLEIKQLLEKLETREIMEVMDSIKKAWKFEGKVSDNTLRTGVEFYLALKQKVISRKYKAVSLIDVDGMKKLLGFPPAMIFMLLADNLGVCTIPENDVPGSVTQLITKYLTGQIGAYMEFYEFMEDRILAGVPDFVPEEVVDGPIKVLPTKFGDLNEGLLNVSKVKTGNVTLCRLASTGDRYSMHIVTGRAAQPGKWEEIGWTPPVPQLPSLEIFLDRPVEEFAQNVMSQHYIISYGNNFDLYRNYCQIAGISIIS